MSDELTPDNIMQLGFGFWSSKTLLSAVELGVFSELAEKALDLETLRERLSLHPRSARDFFDARRTSSWIAPSLPTSVASSRWPTRVFITSGDR